jgi:hypothetical protein
MADYVYPDDGKLHVRFSELVRCTEGQIDRVVAERKNPASRVETEDMKFGTARHDMWAEESKRTGMIPECFKELEGLYQAVTHVEKEFVTEIAPGIVVHSRPDALCSAVQRICDYKTVIDGVRGFEKNLSHYRTSKQGLFYMFQLAIHNETYREIVYMCEVWNKERTKIIAYRAIVQRPKLIDAAAMRGRAIKAATLLRVALTRDAANR